MKLASIGSVTATAALGVALSAAVADRTEDSAAPATSPYPPGCTIVIDGSAVPIPRAVLIIENRRGEVVQATLAARYGLPATSLGAIGPGESRVIVHAVPAGRNLLIAKDGRGWTAHVIVTVTNRGAATCGRRYVWRIG